jgi:hypothetical protein
MPATANHPNTWILRFIETPTPNVSARQIVAHDGTARLMLINVEFEAHRMARFMCTAYAFACFQS